MMSHRNNFQVSGSERRCYDSNKDINLKVKAILRNMMIPVICIGETKLDRELRRTSKIIKTQLFKALSSICCYYILNKAQSKVLN